ncbi:MAG: ABC-2 type transport system ATP-binding protein [Planctomycetota bacterium]|jgi:ABC-2 type transport system ATP-binding protein
MNQSNGAGDRTAAAKVIEIENLTIRYGTETAVADVSLEVRKGEIFGFLGPNGAGKTSTMRVLLGLLRPDSGRLRWFGSEMAEPDKETLSRIGFLPGDLALPDFLTGTEVLEFFARLHGKAPVFRDEFLEFLGFQKKALSRKVRQYSTGMRQMIGLTTAIQHDPDLLILDEPTTGLDPLVRSALIEWLKLRAADGCTVLFSSHVLSEIEACADRIALVHRGLIQFEGGLNELREKFPRRVTIVAQDGSRNSFDHHGDASELLERLRAADPVDFEVRSADLGTLFRGLANDKKEIS